METDFIGVNSDTKRLFFRGEYVPLTDTEFKVFEAIFSRKGDIVTKEQIMADLYKEEGSKIKEKIIDVFVCKLRKKLDIAGAGKNVIGTVWGKGYMIRRAAPVYSVVPDYMGSNACSAQGEERDRPSLILERVLINGQPLGGKQLEKFQLLISESPLVKDFREIGSRVELRLVCDNSR